MNVNTTDCPDAARLRELLDGALPEAEQAVLTTHLESCEKCQQTVEGLAAGRDSWIGAAQQLGAGSAPADPVLQSAMDRARELPPSAATQLPPELPVELPEDFLAPSDEPGHLGKLVHYDVYDVVGRGAMGIVLRAFDQKLHRVVAIKVMAPQLASSASARKRFIREGQAAAAVCHEHVVTIHAVEEAHGLPFLVMQYVGGVSLQDRLDAKGPLEVREILRIGMQAAEGLDAAHAQGLVHRDIKPSNILLENGVERVKITDFGLARAVDDASLTQTGVIAGTPQYMAPEQAHGAALDHRADLFSLGSVLYAMCAGRPPFRSSTMMAVLKRVCEETPRPIREINPDIPDWLAAIISKLHAKNPADRFQSAKEVGDLLGRHLAHLQQPDRVAPPLPVTVPAADRPNEFQVAASERSQAGFEEWRAIERQYRTRMLAAGLMGGMGIASVAVGTADSEVAYVLRLLPGVALFVLLIHSLVRRLLTVSWNGTFLGLFAMPRGVARPGDRPGLSEPGVWNTLFLIVCLLGSAACFLSPVWLQWLPIPRSLVAGSVGVGWFLIAVAFFRSALSFRKPRATEKRSVVMPPVDGSRLQQVSTSRIVLLTALAVCTAILLVPIGLAAMIGVSWLAFAGRAAPTTSAQAVPANVNQQNTNVPSGTAAQWNISENEKALQGRWFVVSQESRGKTVPADARTEWLQFGSDGDANRFTESLPSGQLMITRFRVLDEINPSVNSFRDDDETSKPNARPACIILGDYEQRPNRYGFLRMAEDTLTLCVKTPNVLMAFSGALREDVEEFLTSPESDAVLYVLKRDRSGGVSEHAFGRSTDLIAGEWRLIPTTLADSGDVTIEHEPVQNNAPVKVTGWLLWATTKTRMHFEGTFDPSKELIEITFEKDLLPDIRRSARLTLSRDGSLMSGHYHMSHGDPLGTESTHHWVLKRKSKLPETPVKNPDEN